MRCDDIRERLIHHQAGEVDGPERGRIDAHLAACRDCARRAEVEAGFSSILAARIERHQAPPGLETRIRAALVDAAQPDTTVARFGSSWLAAPAALLLALLVVSGMLVDGGTLRGDGQPFARVVTVVDQACDRAGVSHEGQRRCGHRGHVNVLKTDAGDYLAIGLSGPVGRRLISDPLIRGRTVRVEGTVYSGNRTIEVDRAIPTVHPPVL